jgi:hypothetical protein
MHIRREMMRRKHPPAEMLAELQQTFSKYNWSGKPIGLVPSIADAGTAAVPARNDSKGDHLPTS